MAKIVPEVGDQIVKKYGKVLTFHDWREISTYDPACRKILIDWTKAVGKQNPAAHILLKQGLVSMGVSVGAMFLPNLHIFTSANEFEARLRDTLAQDSGSTTTPTSPNPVPHPSK